MNNSDTTLKGGFISDWLLDNHKSLQKRNDFEDLCDSLDDIQVEEYALGYRDGYENGYSEAVKQLTREVEDD